MFRPRGLILLICENLVFHHQKTIFIWLYTELDKGILAYEAKWENTTPIKNFVQILFHFQSEELKKGIKPLPLSAFDYIQHVSI